MVGQILVNQWGYSMALVDFYQVVDETQKTITVREIEGRRVEDNGPAGARVVALADNFASDKTYRAIKSKYVPNEWRSKLSHVGRTSTLRVWDGKSVYYNDWD